MIGRLSTDEGLRARFLADPKGVLRQLRETGLDLTPAESEALLEMPEEAWLGMSGWVHPRLQKVALKQDRSKP